MYSYDWISVVAVACYTFLLMLFAAARKNRIIISFMYMMVVMALWTGGSYLMRIQMPPGLRFWFHISILGLFLLPCAIAGFIGEFTGRRSRRLQLVKYAVVFILYTVNIITEVLIAPPQAVISSRTGKAVFIYHFGWPVAVVFAAYVLLALDIFRLMHSPGESRERRRQLFPLKIGIAALIAGHVLLLLPQLKGFPVDILAGCVNAFCMFYALYTRRLFRLSFLASRTSCYALTGAVILVLTYYLIRPLERLLSSGRFRLGSTQVIMVIISLLLIFTILCYRALTAFMNRLFVREEHRQSENLKDFSRTVARTLSIQKIVSELASVITESVQADHVYICVQDQQGNYSLTRSEAMIAMEKFEIEAEHPLACCLKASDGCILLGEFRRSNVYRAMWEKEKQQIDKWKVDCFVPIKEDSELIGFAMLERRKKRYSNDDITFLNSLGSVSSMAIKNSRLYERAYEEARHDDLTGVYNRKWFLETVETMIGQQPEQEVVLALLSIDDFTLYNQLYGAREGDKALRKVAGIITRMVGDGGFVARYKGKMFAVLLPGCDLYAGRSMIENICRQVRELNAKAKDYKLKMLTLSCGICGYPYTAGSAKELLYNSELAVFRVRRAGKNGVMVSAAGESMEQSDGEAEAGIGSAYNEYASTIFALTAAIDAKDHYTFSHSKNVAYYAGELAAAWGLERDHVEIVKEAALLHDIGKIGIPEHILNKPGRLTDEEYEAMKGHVENAVGIIRHLPSLDYVIPAVIGHHERYDGSGYPRKIAGEDIPLAARILCIADSFDAMVSRRSYKQSMPVEKAVQVLREEAGRQFDPELVSVFIELIEARQIEVISLTELQTAQVTG